MKRVDVYARVRHAVTHKGKRRREAARLFGTNRRTVDKMTAFSIPSGSRRIQPLRRPKLDRFIGVIDAILEAHKQVPKKQRHTSKRVFERLRDKPEPLAVPEAPNRVCSMDFMADQLWGGSGTGSGLSGKSVERSMLSLLRWLFQSASVSKSGFEIVPSRCTFQPVITPKSWI